MDLNQPAPHGEPPREPSGVENGPVRAVELVAGDFLLTVNPLDGSEIESCPPGRRPLAPRRAPADIRDTPPGDSPKGPAPLLEREEERRRLHRLLARGRSVRVTGPGGAGRTSLLAALALDCAALAPDGVIRLSGYRRTANDLLHELYGAVHHTPAYRPGRTELSAALREIAAVVVIDDIEFGGAALDDILDATPECAFLIAAHPAVPAPAGGSHLEEVFLPGLSRTGALELLELGIGRPLDDAENDWAADLWFESEGLPLRFTQAAAVLRRRDGHQPLPNAAGLTVALAGDLTEAARAVLRFAVALGGEVPAPARLPALTGDRHAERAYGELAECGLITAVGARHRLASGVVADLLAAGYGDASADRTRTAAQHYTWWLSETTMTPEAAATESEALLAILQSAQRAGHAVAVTTLARAAAPLLAAASRWSAWERALRCGQEAARVAGETAQEAYFHHELGVLAVCQGHLDRARAELEAATALRSVLADTGSTVAGRRALALVDDLTRPRALPPGTSHTVALPMALPMLSPAAAAMAAEPGPAPGSEELTQIIMRPPQRDDFSPFEEPGLTGGIRRNAAAAVAGGLLLAALGTFVALGMTAGGEDEIPDNVQGPDPSATTSDLPVIEDTPRPSESPSGDPSKDAEESPSASESEETSLPPYVADDPAPPAPDPTTAETRLPGGGSGGNGGGNGGQGGNGGGTPTEDPPTDDPTDDPTDPPTEDPPTDDPTDDATDPPTDDPPTDDPTTATATPTVTPTEATASLPLS